MKALKYSYVVSWCVRFLKVVCRSDVYEEKWNNSFDVVIVGSGNGGLTAALCCHEMGIKNVLVVEKSVFMEVLAQLAVEVFGYLVIDMQKRLEK